MSLSEHKEQAQAVKTQDYSVRCPHCASVLVSQKVSCQIDPDKSLLVATLARCINMGKWDPVVRRTMGTCEKVYSLTMTEEAENTGLIKSRVLNCVLRSKGNHFTLKELKQGYIDFIDMPKSHKSFEDIMNPVQDYRPDKFIEQEEAIF